MPKSDLGKKVSRLSIWKLVCWDHLFFHNIFLINLPDNFNQHKSFQEENLEIIEDNIQENMWNKIVYELKYQIKNKKFINNIHKDYIKTKL